MKAITKLSLVFIFFGACQTKQIEKNNIPQSELISGTGSEPSWSKEEEEVKKATEELLFNVGNYNHKAMAAMSLPDANVGLAPLKQGIPQAKSMTLRGYFDMVGKRDKLTPYYEPPHKYSIEISDGRLAFVRAECYLYRMGVKQTFEDDFFTFAKSGDDWKLLSASFTAERLPEEAQVFGLEAFAKSYTQVWGSTRPKFVAMFFAENGTLRVNDGEIAKGRDQIAGVADGFMTDLPDMRVHFDSLDKKPNHLEFFWTLTATHATSGNKINVSGSEEWTLEKNLILQSQGHFPTELYNDQIENGTANEQ